MWGVRLVEVTPNTFPDVIVIKTRVFLIQEICFAFFFVRNLCGLYEFVPLCNLSQGD
jgi:hypothetical protein